jgi:hypothetical protein
MSEYEDMEILEAEDPLKILDPTGLRLLEM